MRIGLSAAAASETGLVRSHNEDSFYTSSRLWAVVDGMGGQAAGDTASNIAVRCLAEAEQNSVLDQTSIAGLIERMNSEILQYGAHNPRAAGLGATVAGVSLVTLAGLRHWLVFHVGDSRVYRLADGELTRETVDHSEVQSMVDRGEISADEARTHPQRNILTRCLGSAGMAKADMRLVPYRPGDRLLICSDGLNNEIGDDQIQAIMTTAPSASAAVEDLIDAALGQGGHDNITAVVVVVDEADNDQPEPDIEDTLAHAAFMEAHSVEPHPEGEGINVR